VPIIFTCADLHHAYMLMYVLTAEVYTVSGI